MIKRFVICLLLFLAPVTVFAQQEGHSVSTLLKGLAGPDELKPLKTVIVARSGQVVAEHGYRGHTPLDSTNIKSASKSIISALVGIAIDKGLLEGPEQKIAPILRTNVQDQPDPRINDITIGNLLSMQA